MKSFNCDDAFRKLREKDLGSLGLFFFIKISWSFCFRGFPEFGFSWGVWWVCDFKEAPLATSGHISPLSVWIRRCERATNVRLPSRSPNDHRLARGELKYKHLRFSRYWDARCLWWPWVLGASEGTLVETRGGIWRNHLRRGYPKARWWVLPTWRCHCRRWVPRKIPPPDFCSVLPAVSVVEALLVGDTRPW